MTAHTDAVTQLADELGDLATRLGSVLGTDILLAVTRRVGERTASLVAAIVAGGESATAADILTVLHPDGPPLDWWRTPLGRVCAMALGADDNNAVTHAAAATMLGVHRGTVAQLVQRGALVRHPDGGVARSSVLARLARHAVNDSGR